MQGQYIRLQAIDEYWGPLKPPVKDVDITARKEASVRMTALKAGEVHLIDNVSPEDARMLSKEQVVTARASETLSIRMNVKTGITTDKRVRKAMAYAIDRESIVRDTPGVWADAAGAGLQRPDAWLRSTMKDYPYDLEKAKALVKEAGAEGAEIMLTGATAQRWLKDREIQEAVAAMINKTGLKVNLKLLELTEATTTSTRSRSRSRRAASPRRAATSWTPTASWRITPRPERASRCTATPSLMRCSRGARRAGQREA